MYLHNNNNNNNNIIIIIIIIIIMMYMKCFMIPVITGATGIVTEGLKKILKHTKKAFSRFSTKSSCTRDFAHT
jgi:hypothetical protein